MSWVSLLSPKALSVIDLMVKLRVEKTSPTALASKRSWFFLVKLAHLLYIFFCPEAVVLMSWMTALFFKA